MNLYQKLKIDAAANRHNGKGKLIAISYRIANHITKSNNTFIKIVGYPFLKLYHWFFLWLLGVEIPENTSIGTGMQVWHGTALVINPGAVIGDNVLLRHCTTIGNKFLGSPSPIIGNNVEIGSHCVLIGGIEIGDNTIIGAGSIVTKSIPANSIVYGNPAQYKPKKQKI